MHTHTPTYTTTHQIITWCVLCSHLPVLPLCFQEDEEGEEEEEEGEPSAAQLWQEALHKTAEERGAMVCLLGKLDGNDEEEEDEGWPGLVTLMSQRPEMPCLPACLAAPMPANHLSAFTCPYSHAHVYPPAFMHLRACHHAGEESDEEPICLAALRLPARIHLPACHAPACHASPACIPMRLPPAMYLHAITQGRSQMRSPLWRSWRP